VARDLDLGTFQQADLTAGVSAAIVVWSSTRAELKLHARSVKEGDPSADPFEVGRPVRLSEEERAELERSHNPPPGAPPGRPELAGRVLCAYRIPLALRAVAKDGKTPFDLGPFRRWVQVEAFDAGEPAQVTVVGQVRGPVTVTNGERGGVVVLGTFPRSKGKRATVTLESEVAGVMLEVDRERMKQAGTDFLTADLGAPSKGGPTRTWRMQVEVKPNSANGPFPRREDPAYRDSAIYLKVWREVNGGRTALPPVRIPVYGTANEG
jgi:hypothetical protein